MSEAAQNVIDWLRQQPDWLQESAELVLGNGSASEEDIDHLVARLKSGEGLTVTMSRTFEALGLIPTAAPDLRLSRVGNIHGIEKLDPKTPLTFGPGNLTVVYGANGSGKSGYGRILKRACGKPQAQPLHANVYESPPSERHCTVGFCSAGLDRDVNWDPDGPAISELRVVDLFDSGIADRYLLEETEATYTPPVLALFEGIASCCNRVREKLDAQRRQLTSTIPDLPPQYLPTQAGAAYRRLRAAMSEQDIAELTHWTEADQGSLDQLAIRLNVADPAIAAQQKRAAKTLVDRIVSELESAGAALSSPQLTALRCVRANAKQQRQIATEAADACSQSARLDGIGTATWRALWGAARAYSLTPYPDGAFPVTSAGARCVLCQQQLSDEARQRMRDFEAFVQGTIEATAQAAEKTYVELLEAVPTAPSDEDFLSRCAAAGIDSEIHKAEIKTFWQNASKAAGQLRLGEPDGEVLSVEPPAAFISALKHGSVALEEEAKKYEEDAAVFDRAPLKKQKIELEARKWVSEQEAAIRKEIVRLRAVEGLQALANAANSQSISVKAGQIAESIITEAYIARFNVELKRLGAAHIQVELVKTHTVRGRTKHKLVLKGVGASQTLPGSVLSDGERRVVSLAAFLADVADKPYTAPFVFDDPISSLDSEYEWQVALRLAELAKERQVIVLTHRLSLYGAMEEAAGKNGEDWRKQQLEQRCIESYGGSSGHPTDEQVWNANTRKANNILLQRLVDAKKAGESSGAAGYRLHAQGICSDFRKLVERTIEDDLLNEVVKRHRRSVTTNNRLAHLSRIDPDDCTYLDALMTKYSCYEHSQSTETPVWLPEEPELRADLEQLKLWREEFKGRGTVHA